MTEDEFTQGMKFLERCVPTFKPVKAGKNDPGTYDAFWEVLRDLDGDIFKAACIKVSTDCEWVSVKALRDAAAQISLPAQMSGLEAWGMVIAEVRRGVGYPYAGGNAVNAPQTSITDPLIMRCVESVGGWRALQLSTSEQDISNRSQFIRAYESLAGRYHNEMKQTPHVKAAMQERGSLIGNTLAALAKKLSAPK